MTKPVQDFANLFHVKIRLEDDLLVKKRGRYFLLNQNLKRAVSSDFFYAGTYLGEVKNGRFLPGFELLRMLARKKTDRVVVDKKTEWLFICGRDVFKQGITEVLGSGRKGDHVLVLNSHHECLGFGRIVCDLNEAREGVVIENIVDVGDFLRRETQPF
jgi:ribosome biogenesis protein Nip4